MRIRMVTDRTGPRWDGRDWPPRGGEIDVDDDEGAALCEHGIAVPVAVEERAETPEDTLEQATQARAAAKPAPGGKSR